MEEVLGDVVEGFEDLVELGDRFGLHPLNFELTSEYDPEKDKEEENLRTKIILNYTFQELGFNPKNPEIVEEMIEEEKRIRWFKTNRPNIQLGYDEIDWWLELIEKNIEKNSKK
jgi:hypothetical protein